MYLPLSETLLPFSEQSEYFCTIWILPYKLFSPSQCTAGTMSSEITHIGATKKLFARYVNTLQHQIPRNFLMLLLTLLALMVVPSLVVVTNFHQLSVYEHESNQYVEFIPLMTLNEVSHLQLHGNFLRGPYPVPSSPCLCVIIICTQTTQL